MKNLAKLFGIIMLFMTIGFSFSACNNGSTDPNPNLAPIVYNIGDTGPGGGIIFYKSEAGFTLIDSGVIAHYLEVAPVDTEQSLAWASSSFVSTDIKGTSITIGSGRNNTAIILATDNAAPAAKACNDLDTGKDDWFLPSKDELNELYLQKNLPNIGLDTTVYPVYLSSSQYNSTSAWSQNVQAGNQGVQNKPDFGANNAHVRAIRAF